MRRLHPCARRRLETKAAGRTGSDVRSGSLQRVASVSVIAIQSNNRFRANFV